MTKQDKNLDHYKAIIRFLLLISLLFATSTVFAKTILQKSTVINNLQPIAYFEENRGQFPKEFQFVTHNQNLFYGFFAQSIIVKKRHAEERITLTFANSNAVNLLAGKEHTARISYLKGRKAHWKVNVATYQNIYGKELYPGIDIKYYFNDNLLEYDFIVQAGADPDNIQITLDGTTKLTLNEQGNLEITLGDKTLVQRAPFVYQVGEDKQKQIIEARYVLAGNQISFDIAEYDKSRELVIDPIIEVSGLIGGEWEDQANAIAEDSAGNIYVVGSTASRARITHENIISLENTAIPTQQDTSTTNYYNAVHGISLDASFINNNVIDLERNFLLDANGDVLQEQYEYACDYTYQGFFRLDRLVTDYDGYISKYDANFNLIYTTYFGGCRNDGIRALAIDANDNVYIGGLTLSQDFPISSPSQSALAESRLTSEPIVSDGFYAKFDSNGDLIYSSYLGGNGRDGIRDIAVDANENLHVVGYTHSTNLKTTCVVGSIPVLECENLGGVKSVEEVGASQDVSVYSDAFLAKIGTLGDSINFLTYLGGKYDDWAQSIVLSDSGIYVAGNSSSPDITTTGSGYSFSAYRQNSQSCSRTPIEDDIEATIADLHLCEDAFLMKISLDGTSLDFSTYLGGQLDDNVYDLTLDSQGNIYLAGTTRSRGGFFDLDNPQSFESNEQLAAYNELFNESFPLYKNINQYEIDSTTQINNAFFTVFNSDATRLIQSSFLGGSEDDSALVVQVSERNDGSEIVDVYIGGHTISKDFYTVKPFNSRVSNNDVFVVKLALDMTQASETYDLSEEPFLSNPDSCYPVSDNGCGLYTVLYSTLIGGEGLEDLKDLILVNNGLILSGTTFSEKFPIVGNTLKSRITKVDNINYEPNTRDIIDQVEVIPSDAFIIKMNDTDQSVDLALNVQVDNENDIDENDTITFRITVTNRDALQTADDVRLVMTYPYLSALENLPSRVTTTLDTAGCVYALTQLYCRIGFVEAQNTTSITIAIHTANDGAFPVSFNVSNVQADNDQSNNVKDMTLNIKAVSSGASLSFVLFLSPILLFGLRLLLPKLKHFNKRS